MADAIHKEMLRTISVLKNSYQKVQLSQAYSFMQLL